MKLSEAIMLGSTQIRLEPKLFLHDDCGCLIGFGLKAAEEKNYYRMYEFWPWLDNYVTAPEFLSRGHIDTWDIKPGNSYYAEWIISAIAWQVKNGVTTLEEAVDWIRSVEPQEPTETTTETTDVHLRDLQKV